MTQKYAVHSAQINTQINRGKNKLKAGIVEIFSNKKEKVSIENDQLVGSVVKKVISSYQNTFGKVKIPLATF